MMVSQNKDDDGKRVVRPMERRRKRPRLLIHVAQPGVVVINQGTREDVIDAPPGSRIERPKPSELTSP